MDVLPADPTVPGYYLRADYYDVLADLRRDAPVHEFAPGMLTIARYDDIREISRDPARFCSSMGALVNDPMRTTEAADEGGVDPAHGSARPRRLPQARESRVHAARDHESRTSHSSSSRVRWCASGRSPRRPSMSRSAPGRG